MNTTYSIYQIHSKIDAMSKFLNLKKYIEGDKNTLDMIRSYYRINHWAYRHYHSQDGFMHFRISKNGCFTDEDVYQQPDSVSELIKDGDFILELGCGQCANLLYLAHSHPNATFAGVDLCPCKVKDLPQNTTIYTQDYSSLAQFPDHSVDVVFAFETLVHCSDKEKVYREVFRVMKPGGRMIVYDYALKNRYETYDDYMKMAISLISKGGASALIESLEEMNAHYVNCGLEIEKCVDFTKEILPDLKHLERKATKILKRPWLAKLMFGLLPDQGVTNIILGYLGYNLGNADVGTYREWVLRKP